MTFRKDNFKKPKCILFDWDGTLVDTNSLYKPILSEILEEMNIKEFNLEAQEKYRYHSRRESLPLIFGDNWEEINRAYAKKIEQIGLNSLVPFTQSLDLIKYFHSEDVMMSIVSNKDGGNLRREVDHLGWTKCFHKIIGAGDAKRDKPWTDPVELALEGEVKKGDHIWFIGDSMVDMQCAKNASCFPILFGTETKSHLSIADLDIDYLHIHQHGELINRYKEIK